MASFVAPFDPASVSKDPDVVVPLQATARYPDARLPMLHVSSAQEFPLVSPVRGTVCLVDLAAGLDGGVNRLVELSPLPFATDQGPIDRVLRGLGGLPTFYVGFAPVLLQPDELVPQGGPLGMVDHAYLGVLFQDGVALDPWGWIELLGRAMAAAGEDPSQWTSLATLYRGVTGFRVLDAAGRPVSARFTVRVGSADPTEASTSADGLLSVDASGQPIALTWPGDPLAEDTPLPVVSHYEGRRGAPPGESLLLPAGTTRGHLQVLDLSRWFAPPPRSSRIARYRPDSRFEPLVDGIPTFRRLLEDLRASAAPGYGAHLAGIAFKDFPLDPAQLRTCLSEITEDILGQGGGVRILAYKAVNFKQDPTSDVERNAGLLVFAMMSALTLLHAFSVFDTNAAGFTLFFGGSILAANVLGSVSVPSVLERLVEESWDLVQDYKRRFPHLLIWSPHPARLVDNPVAVRPLELQLLGLTVVPLERYIDQVGVWHQKIQLLRRTPDPDGNEYIAYLGGIDINYDRFDDPGHHGKAYQDPKRPPPPLPPVAPRHDLHARITGPAAADVFQTWDERYAHERQLDPQAPDSVFSPPRPTDLTRPATEAAGHLVQIGRTYFRPNHGAGSAGFPYAPDGEITIANTLFRAIDAAQDYIYIEDQYFVPSGPFWGPGYGFPRQDFLRSYMDHLINAAWHCKRLLVLLPSESDQPFGDIRRRCLIDLLRRAWGDRMLVGVPMRRPILPNPGRVASEGRCILLRSTGTETGDTTLLVGPRARVPEQTPFWVWIDGELMLAHGVRDAESSAEMPAKVIEVVRGQAGTGPSWDTWTRGHEKGAAVTLAQLRGIYVHAKAMMVDDVFVAIGSANLNRRALYHDGEIAAFAVPEALKSARDNPARALRTALWAEHLGLPPAMGASLLGDPLAAFELFKRSHWVGNRFTRFEVLDVRPFFPAPLSTGLFGLLAGAFLIGEVETQLPMLWADVIDPTTNDDPDDNPGPSCQGGSP